MKLNFIINDNYIAFFALERTMHNQSESLNKIKQEFELSNDIGYKKIKNHEMLDISVYLKNKKILDLLEKLIRNNIFKEIYKMYDAESERKIAIMILSEKIKINDSKLENLKNELWDSDREGYKDIFNINEYNPAYYFLDNDVVGAINNFKNTDEFKKIYQEAFLYCEMLKKYWNQISDEMAKYLINLLRININQQIDVYITHPDSCTGFSFNGNSIVWGHYKGLNEL